MALTEFFGRVIAVSLERVDLTGDPAERGDRFAVFFGSGSELLAGFGLEKEFRQVGGGELKADLGELAGVVLAEELDKVILEQTVLESALLLEAPFFETAAGFPVGDVAGGDGNPDFGEGADDLFWGNVVLEHAVDHVALELGKAGDSAIAGADYDWGLDGRRWMLDARSDVVWMGWEWRCGKELKLGSGWGRREGLLECSVHMMDLMDDE